MLTAPKPTTMSRRLAVRLIVTALGVSVALFCFFFAKYMLDVPNIRQLTLRGELAAIRESIAKDQFDSTSRGALASWLTRLAASVARRRSEYLASGAETVSST